VHSSWLFDCHDLLLLRLLELSLLELFSSFIHSTLSHDSHGRDYCSPLVVPCLFSLCRHKREEANIKSMVLLEKDALARNSPHVLWIVSYVGRPVVWIAKSLNLLLLIEGFQLEADENQGLPSLIYQFDENFIINIIVALYGLLQCLDMSCFFI